MRARRAYRAYARQPRVFLIGIATIKRTFVHVYVSPGQVNYAYNACRRRHTSHPLIRGILSAEHRFITAHKPRHVFQRCEQYRKFISDKIPENFHMGCLIFSMQSKNTKMSPNLNNVRQKKGIISWQSKSAII